MNTKNILPIEIINHILSFRPTHPISSIVLKSVIDEYNKSDDNGDYYFSFYEYTLEQILKTKNINCSDYEIENIIKVYNQRSRDFKIKEGLASWAP